MLMPLFQCKYKVKCLFCILYTLKYQKERSSLYWNVEVTDDLFIQTPLWKKIATSASQQLKQLYHLYVGGKVLFFILKQSQFTIGLHLLPRILFQLYHSFPLYCLLFNWIHLRILFLSYSLPVSSPQNHKKLFLWTPKSLLLGIGESSGLWWPRLSLSSCDL